MIDENPILLEASDFHMKIQPRFGGMVANLNWMGSGRRQAILHPASDVQSTDSTAARYGLWPLTPFANRAFGGVLLVDGQALQLPVNDPTDGSAMHGYGWQCGWDVVAPHDDRIELRHAYTRADPYHYTARFSVVLAKGKATFALSLRNTGPRPLPFGIGLHPWFPRQADMRLRMNARAALQLGPRYLATDIRALNPAEDYSTARTLPAETAVSFIDWDGCAELMYPARGLAVTIKASPTLRHPVLWTPMGAPFVCFEPQSHAIGAPSEALVQMATPMARLDPGEELSGWMTLKPRSI